MNAINIQTVENKSWKGGEIELLNYTILAGENNSGKSNILKSIFTSSTKKDGKTTIYTPLFIPSDKVSASAESDPSKKTTFKEIIDPILNEIFSETSKEHNTKDFVMKISEDLEEKIKPVLDSINETLKETKKKFDIKVEGITTDMIVKNIIKTYAKDLFRSGEEVDLDSIGQGTQRLIVYALLKYLAERKESEIGEIEVENKFILFEEPENFLHPKLKKNLHKSLVDLSKRGYYVVITTHDPYFISLVEDEKIYQVTRNQNGYTDLDSPKLNRLLTHTSNAEVNYIIFEVPSCDYCLNIYEVLYIQKKNKIGEHIELHNGNKVTLRDFRNQIGHIEVTDFDDEGEDGKSLIRKGDVENENNMKKFIDTCIELINK